MIADRDTNQVFVSEWLQKVHPAFFSRFSELLKNVHINMTLLSNTADIWCRDYMPIQLAEEDFLQYRLSRLSHKERIRQAIYYGFKERVQCFEATQYPSHRFDNRWRECG